jgi:alcohol dehydrogenase/propanol-preferring alcohol dehydrogenase
MDNFTLTEFGQPLVIRCEPELAPRGTEVLVEVSCCGVCQTDLSIKKGYYDLGGGKKYSMRERGMTPPIVLGHEVSGRLVALGPDAAISEDQIGRTFVVYPWIGCGECLMCKEGEENLCLAPQFLGLQRPGGHAERLIVPHARYLVDIGNVDPALAATYACSGLTSYGALSKLAPQAHKAPLLLIGGGGLGQSALSIAKALGYRHVVVADTDRMKREIAVAAGATRAIDPTTCQDEDFAGHFASVIDFVGSTGTYEYGVKALRRGGRYVIVGLAGGEITQALPPISLRPISVIGSLTGSLDDLRALLNLAKSGKLRPLEIERQPRSATNEVLDRVRDGQVRGRLVLVSQSGDPYDQQ